eukprot:TRINITY_DN26703_c0_g1_i1.p1 TRINITY_DN26703_c0_g1~~TRINITY_DN26703_c0_g1_i1.p1  ORF type:complete len:119 (+),score=2.48 TRINITY_DN26703_c0_g1_i1:124-480(+)
MLEETRIFPQPPPPSSCRCPLKASGRPVARSKAKQGPDSVVASLAGPGRDECASDATCVVHAGLGHYQSKRRLQRLSFGFHKQNELMFFNIIIFGGIRRTGVGAHGGVLAAQATHENK